MQYNLTLKGYEHKVPKQYTNVIGLSRDESMVHELMQIPPDAELHLLRPPGLSAQWWNPFESMVKDALSIRNMSLNVMDRNQKLWIENLFKNKERFVGYGDYAPSWPVNRLAQYPYKDNYAVIVGNGPSAWQFGEYGLDGGAVFATWHSAWKIEEQHSSIEFVGHCDPLAPAFDFRSTFKPRMGIIATPTVAPEFLNAYEHSDIFAFCSQDVWMHSLVAKELGCGDHPMIHGTVVHMLINSALMAGYKRIILIGVDLGSQDPTQEDMKNGGNMWCGLNSHGVKVYTNDAYQAFGYGLSALAKENPDVQFFNASKIGVDIEGFRAL